MQSTRLARLAHQLQQEVALIIHQELKNPRLGFVTITRVELSCDVRHAKVWFSCLGPETDRMRSAQALAHSGKFIQSLIKKRFRLKVIPELAFRYDESIAGSIDMFQALDRLTHSDEGQPGQHG